MSQYNPNWYRSPGWVSKENRLISISTTPRSSLGFDGLRVYSMGLPVSRPQKAPTHPRLVEGSGERLGKARWAEPRKQCDPSSWAWWKDSFAQHLGSRLASSLDVPRVRSLIEGINGLLSNMPALKSSLAILRGTQIDTDLYRCHSQNQGKYASRKAMRNS